MYRHAAVSAAVKEVGKGRREAADHVDMYSADGQPQGESKEGKTMMTADKVVYEVDMLMNTYKLSRRLIAFLLQLFVYIAILIIQRDIKDSHILEDMVEYELVGRPSDDGLTFKDIVNAEELWSWSEEVLMPLLYTQEYYNGEPLEEAVMHTIGLQTKFIGGIRVTQERYGMDGDECYESQYDRIGLHCRGGESKEPFGSPPDPLVAPAFEYRCDPRDDFCGFFVDMDLGLESVEEEKAELDMLKEGRWIDVQTKTVAFDCTLYCHNLKMWVIADLILEFGPAGRVEPKYEVRVLQLDPYNFNRPINRFRLFLEIVYASMTGFFLVTMLFDFLYKCRCNPRTYVTHTGGLTMTLLELTGMGLSLASIFLWAVYIRLDERRDLMKHYPFHNEFVDLWKVVEWEDKWVAVTSINLLIQTMRSLKFFQVTRGGARLILSVASAVPEVASFIPVYVTIMLGYAFAGYFIFGVRLAEWSTFDSAIFRVYEINYGLYDTDTLYTEGEPKAVVALYLYSGTLIIVVMLLNVFLAIVMSTWDSLSQMEEEAKARLHKPTWRDMLSLLRLRGRELMSVEPHLVNSFTDEEQEVSRAEFIKTLLHPGTPDLASPRVFSKLSMLRKAQQRSEGFRGKLEAIPEHTAEVLAVFLYGKEEEEDFVAPAGKRSQHGDQGKGVPGHKLSLKKTSVYPETQIEVESPVVGSPSTRPMLGAGNGDHS
eukprot:jgi/Mesvir1/23798/Mv10611-RA.1